jgi:archaellum component FlaC
MEKHHMKYQIISFGLQQRKVLLSALVSKRKQFEALSDLGWFMTLGSEALGMLSAVIAGQKARQIDEEIERLEKEIHILQEAKYELLKM